MVQQLRTPRGRTALAAATFGAWCVASALTVPVAAQNREHQQMAAELRMLQEQQQQLAVTLAQVIESLKAMPTRIDDASAAARKGFADQELRAGALAETVGQIRERTQDTDTRLRSLRDEVDALRATLAALQGQLTQLAQAPAPSLDPVDLVQQHRPPRRRPPRAVPRRPPPGLSPSRMLESAKSDYFASQFTLALSGFEAVLRTFPAHGVGQRGAVLHRRDPLRAETMDARPSPPTRWWCRTTPARVNVPEAYYKRGRAYEELGQIDAARASWELVVKTYPRKHGRHAGEAGTGPLEPQGHAVIE